MKILSFSLTNMSNSCNRETRRPSVVVPMLPDRDVEKLWNETLHFNSTNGANGDHQEASRKLIKAILIYGSFSVLYMITAIKIFIKVR